MAEMSTVTNMDHSSLSIGLSKKVCGYTISQMHLGAFLSALKRLNDFPQELIRACFGDVGLKDALDQLIAFDEETLAKTLRAILIVSPYYVVGLISDLSGIETEVLLNDKNIGVNGLLEIVDAVIYVNNLKKVSSRGKIILESMTADITNRTISKN